jgi:hypothetical protein
MARLNNDARHRCVYFTGRESTTHGNEVTAMFQRRVMRTAYGLIFVPLAHVAAPEGLAGVASQQSSALGTAPGAYNLPAEAKASISAALGRDQPVYHAKRAGEAWRLDNPKHGLQATFTARGVEVQSGSARFRLQLTGVG